jgi:NADH-quinone oxidoreductase subunit B
MASAASKFDIARFGMERMSFSPRQADMLICAGRLPYKMASVLRMIWDQMPQPKWSISMGACASTGGVFDAYSMVQGIDTIIPVDVYVPGCPPRPEGLIYGILLLQEKIRGESVRDTAVLRAEDPDRVGKPNLPADMIEQIAGPFGNSTKQNRVSGLVATGALARPVDRQP